MTTRRPRLQIRPNVKRISRDANSTIVKKQVSTVEESGVLTSEVQSDENAEKKPDITVPLEECKIELNDNAVTVESNSASVTAVNENHEEVHGRESAINSYGDEDIKPIFDDNFVLHLVEPVNSVHSETNETTPDDLSEKEPPSGTDEQLSPECPSETSEVLRVLSDSNEVNLPQSVLSPSEPTPVSSVSEPIPVSSVSEPTPVSSVLEPTPVSSVSEPTLVSSVSEPILHPASPITSVPESPSQTASVTTPVSSSAPSTSTTPRLSALLSAPPSYAANVGKVMKKPRPERETRPRQWHNKFKEPLERSKMTMLDLIYWNPTENPMKSKDKNNSVVDQVATPATTQPMPKNENVPHEASNRDDNSDPLAPPAPKLKIGPNGEITLDEESLVIEHTAPESYSVVTEESDTNYFSFRNKQAARRWTLKETAVFYKALMMVGTDFALMSNLISDRSRHELKLKFKKEERINRQLIDRILSAPNVFDVEQFELETEELLRLLPEDDPVKKKRVARTKSKPAPRPMTREDSVHGEVIEKSKNSRKGGRRKTAKEDPEPMDSDMNSNDLTSVDGELDSLTDTRDAEESIVESEKSLEVRNDEDNGKNKESETNEIKSESARTMSASTYNSHLEIIQAIKKPGKRKFKTVSVENESVEKLVKVRKARTKKSTVSVNSSNDEENSLHSQVEFQNIDPKKFNAKRRKSNNLKGVPSLALERPRRIIKRPKYLSDDNDYSVDSSDDDGHSNVPETSEQGESEVNVSFVDNAESLAPTSNTEYLGDNSGRADSSFSDCTSTIVENVPLDSDRTVNDSAAPNEIDLQQCSGKSHISNLSSDYVRTFGENIESNLSVTSRTSVPEISSELVPDSITDTEISDSRTFENRNVIASESLHKTNCENITEKNPLKSDCFNVDHSKKPDVLVMPVRNDDLGMGGVGSFVTVEATKGKKRRQKFTPCIVGGVKKVRFNQAVDFTKANTGCKESSSCLDKSVDNNVLLLNSTNSENLNGENSEVVIALS